jgi:hypothetical protein
VVTLMISRKFISSPVSQYPFERRRHILDSVF